MSRVITNHMVRDWNAKLAAGATKRGIAAEYGVSVGTVHNHCPQNARPAYNPAQALAGLTFRATRNERLIRSCLQALSEARI